jgi:outer membrane receptor for ferrienterochelin and colicin
VGFFFPKTPVVKRGLISVILFMLSWTLMAQDSGVIRGTLKDKGTGETLIGAAVLYADGKGVTTDIDGRYELTLAYGTYKLTATYVGYESIVKTVIVDSKFKQLDFELGTTTLREVEVVADLAIEAETPVAFSNITPKQIKQELGSNDLPLLLNTTPGVYVSPTGGDDGGARVSIRGFQDRNITVMIDGIPINNMDDGNVFWANTFGIDAVLANMQVQRGMTSSRLAIPAVGGTINFITKSIENEESVFLRQDYGSFNTLRTSFGYNSGRMNKGWGFSIAGSFRKGDGFSEQQYREEYFYYGKVQKEIGNHIISASVLGSPVEYGLRRDRQKIATYDADYAADLFNGSNDLYSRLSEYNVALNMARESNPGSAERMELAALQEELGWDNSEFARIASENDFIDTAGVISKGYRYNNHWGNLNGGIQNERVRQYHKPIFSVRDFWSINENVYWSNVVYYSFGKGGGTARVPSLGFGDYDDNLQVDFQTDYNENTIGGVFGPPISPEIVPDELRSAVVLNKSFDNHSWLGWLSTLDWTISENLTFAGGLDFRTYTSEQYQEVHNLLGGQYYVPSNEDLPFDRSFEPPGNVFREGDRYNYNNENLMRWGAFFTELKYNKDEWRAFVNVSGVVTGYKRIDYFNRRDFIIDGERFPNAIGYSDALFYNGSDVLVAATAPSGATPTFFTSGDTTYVTNPQNNLNAYAPGGNSFIVGARQVNYNDSESQVSEVPWKNIPGFTLKAGASRTIEEKHNVFVNVGYISRTPRFRNVVDLGVLNEFLRDVENENIASVELGYGYRTSNFSASVNAYYTDWQNRPIDGGVRVFLPDRGISVRANLNDMSAVHKGIEFTSRYVINQKLSADLFASFGDWRWNSAKTVNFFDDQGRPLSAVDDNNQPTDSLITIKFDAKDVFVGDAPQTQIGGSLNWEFVKNAYIKGRYTFFDKHYSNFDPLQLQEEDEGRQSWKIPGYGLVSIFGGYRYDFDKVALEFNVIVDNLFNVRYIADATNNSGTSLVTTNYLDSPPQATVAFDANSTAVYFGLPRTFSISLKATL